MMPGLPLSIAVGGLSVHNEISYHLMLQLLVQTGAEWDFRIIEKDVACLASAYVGAPQVMEEESLRPHCKSVTDTRCDQMASRVTMLRKINAFWAI